MSDEQSPYREYASLMNTDGNPQQLFIVFDREPALKTTQENMVDDNALSVFRI